MRAKNKLILGVGVNDANYEVQKNARLGNDRCPYYVRWVAMLTRCYSDRYQKTRPTYSGCYVCEEWLSFTNFKNWMEQQDWTGKQLDKDLIKEGNKIYSPEFCAFVDPYINSFTTKTNRSGNAPTIGAFKKHGTRRYTAKCSNPFTLKQDELGQFDTPEQAHLAWKKRKHELACQLADLQTDERVASALRTRYL